MTEQKEQFKTKKVIEYQVNVGKQNVKTYTYKTKTEAEKAIHDVFTRYRGYMTPLYIIEIEVYYKEIV